MATTLGGFRAKSKRAAYLILYFLLTIVVYLLRIPTYYHTAF